ncbi:hypothetical protein AB833_32135 [Chromatiales bacterium (ex Bugula neritina AB1)]|nr:hypothetical protein AB833_32135 [Chromatiales bacterium (ex Bugula neritina AB1)]
MTTTTPVARINCQFDAGNIEYLSSDTDHTLNLAIRSDSNSDFYQWFYFRLTGTTGERYYLNLTNAGGSSYPRGWEDYQPVVSDDLKTWYRVPAEYKNGQLSFSVKLQTNSLYVAYFTPYSLERHTSFIAEILSGDCAELITVGQTIQGRDLDVLQLGDSSGDSGARHKVWVIARQHPGETMAQWWTEGFVRRLTDRNDAVSAQLLKRCVFYVVPNMNPDGSYLGHLRTNAVGANLNREWLSPDISRSPEVFLVREMMHQTGVDLCLDVHGDEALPYNFIAGPQGTKSWDDSRENQLQSFKSTLQALNPDFQTTHGYPVPPPNSANYGICASYVAETFNCLAMTLEMPFKDTVDTPDLEFGWSAERSANLGRSTVDAMYWYQQKFWQGQ